MQWAASYSIRHDPEYPLQTRPAALLPSDIHEVAILDVGAGPLNYLGKKLPGKKINITAVDPLAVEYDKILKKYNIVPLVRTQCVAAEHLCNAFKRNTFDLVYARNCIDHSFDPERAILQMIDVVKRGGFVLLEHYPDEAEREKYSGLHQWNFSMNEFGEFIIKSKKTEINMTRKYANRCDIKSEIVKDSNGPVWLINRLRKK